MKKSAGTALCAIVLLALSSLSMGAHADKLVVFGDEAYAPVIYMDKGQPAGILPAIIARLSKETGDTYELVLVPWKRAVVSSEEGKGGITGVSRNKARELVYDFSIPIYDDDIQLVVLKGKEFAFRDLKDLKGKTVGGALGASYGDEVDKAIADGVFAVDRDPNQASRLRKLLADRMDVALVGNGAAGLAQLIASDPEVSGKRDKFVALARPITRDPLHLAFAKSMNMKPALERFNKALAAFKKTSEYKKLLNTAR